MSNIHDNIECIVPFITISIIERKLHPYFLTSKSAYSSTLTYKLTEWMCNRPIIRVYTTGELTDPDEFMQRFIYNTETIIIPRMTRITRRPTRVDYGTGQHKLLAYIYFVVYSATITLSLFKVILNHIFPIITHDKVDMTEFVYNILVSAVIRSTKEYEFLHYILTTIPNAQSALRLHKGIILARAALFGNTHVIQYLINNYMTPADIKLNHNIILQIAISNRDIDMFNLIGSYNILTHNDIIDTHASFYKPHHVLFDRPPPHSFHLAVMFDILPIIRRLLEITPISLEEMVIYQCIHFTNPITLKTISLPTLQFLVEYIGPSRLHAKHIFGFNGTTHLFYDAVVKRDDRQMIEYLISTRLADVRNIQNAIDDNTLNTMFRSYYVGKSITHDIGESSDVMPHIKHKWNIYKTKISKGLLSYINTQ